MPFNLGTATGFLRLNASQVVQGVQQALNSIRTLPGQTQQAMGGMQDIYKKNFFALRDLGMAFGGFSTAVAGGFGAAIESAVKWESAMAGVARTTYDTAKSADENSAALSKLNDQITALASQKPTSAIGLASIAEEAGALGIQSDKIAGFTSVIADLDATTSLTAEDATSALARIGNIVDRTNPQFDRMGSTVLELGRSTAATEPEIVAMGKRIAGAGKTVGLSTDQILAYAAALASVGVREEQGGSAISRTFVDIASAVDKGGTDLEGFARVAGVSADVFKQKFKTDAAGATNQFIEGLGRIQKAGGPVFQVMADLGITEVRQRDALLRLASSQGLLAQTLQTGASAWRDNTALAEISQRIYGTASAQIGILKNQIFALAVSIGNSFVPVLKIAVGIVSDVVSGLNALPSPMRTIYVAGIALAAVISGLAAVFLYLIPRIQLAMAAMEAMAGVSVETSAAMGILQTSLGWIGLALTAATILIGVFGARQKDAASDAKKLANAQNEVADAVAQAARGQNIALKAWIANRTVASGLQGDLEKMGIHLADVVSNADSVEGAAKLWAKFGDAVRPTIAAQEAAGKQNVKYTESQQKVYDFLHQTIYAIGQASDAYKLQQQALKDAGLATDEENASQQKAADDYEKTKDKIDAHNKAVIDLVDAQRQQLNAQRAVNEAQTAAQTAADKLAHKSEYLAQAEAAVAKAQYDHEKAIRDVDAAQKTLAGARQEAANKVLDAENTLADAHDRVYDSEKKLADAQDALNKLRAGPDAEKLLEAEQKLRDSALNLIKANQQQADAQWYVNYLRAEGASNRDVQDAEYALAEAQNEVSKATTDGTKAQGDLDKVRAAASPEEIANAERDVDKARRDVEGATRDVGKAESDLQTARDAQAQDTAYKDAQDALATAQQQVADSVINVYDQQTKLRELQDGKLEQDFANTQYALEDAYYRLANANVEVQKQTALSRGETWTTTDAVNALRGELNKMGDDAVGPVAEKLRAMGATLRAETQPRTIPINVDPSGAVAGSAAATTAINNDGQKQKSIMSGVGQWFIDRWGDVLNFVTNNPISNAISSGLHAIGNFITGKDKPQLPHLPQPQGYAWGGVANGPNSGYPAILHGKELILPLDDLSRAYDLLASSGLASALAGDSGGSVGGSPALLASAQSPVVQGGDSFHLTAITNADPTDIMTKFFWSKRVRTRS